MGDSSWATFRKYWATFYWFIWSHWFRLFNIGGGARKDPLGRIIALSLLAIFLLGIFTLCLRICSSTCGADGRKCCVVQCAISVQCCCEWKSGRLRIIPNSGNSVEPTGTNIIKLFANYQPNKRSCWPPNNWPFQLKARSFYFMFSKSTLFFVLRRVIRLASNCFTNYRAT